MCCYLLKYYLIRLYLQRRGYPISRVELRYVLCGMGIIVLLEFFGAFVHVFEVTYDDNFVYPYKGNVHEFVNALRRNEKPEVKPINEYKYAFTLKQPQKCKENADSTFRIVYIVKSAIKNFDRRTAIRNSWGIEKRFFDMPTRTIFVVGMHPRDGYDQEIEAKLKQEAGIYKDIVQADFVDSYYNNTIKMMMSFKWLVKYCPNSKFYMFVDDDMYVSVKNVATFIRNPVNYPFYLMESRKMYSAHKREIKQSDLMDYNDINFNNKNKTYDLKIKMSFKKNLTIRKFTNNNSRKNNMHEKQEQLNENREMENEHLLKLLNTSMSTRTKQLFDFELPDDIRLFAGFVFTRSTPHRHKFSKWYVTLKEYPYHLWPPYVSAGAYILSKEALLDLYYTSFYTKHFRFDDIFLGLVAKKADIVPFHCEEFHFYKKAYTKHSYTYVITSHGYGDSNELLKIWNEQKTLGNA
ncbi:PREDICTED: beta-1,3-galactosyltransferase brn-like [Cyphomyrmex costatus]|uniref:Hexosyltransferase n=1 Tax=Cyphomyrmex costatus TaxID=456900 RepID=A0A151IA93_9HYME|nr:PREDICTED: beta-1,3-galactosyltransferase brn-like [Cyphomyrmex costatus]KYM96223.1 Beta-1,3-galactosyltransferase brn [Cyphomyrmex costatus]